MSYLNHVLISTSLFVSLFIYSPINAQPLDPITPNDSQGIMDQLLARILSHKYQEYKFDVYREGKQIFNIHYLVKPTLYKNEPVVGIYTTINGENAFEENICFLDQQNRIKQIFQTSDNHFENSFFKWEIERDGSKGKSFFYNTKTGKIQTGEFSFPDNGVSLQMLMFLLRDQDLSNPNQSKQFKLLVPPHQFFDIEAKLVREEAIRSHLDSDENRTIQCLRYEVGLSGVLGLFTPKITFWMSKKGQIPIQYTDRDKTVYLVSYDISRHR